MKHFTKTLLLSTFFIYIFLSDTLGQAGYCNLWPRFDQEMFPTVTKTADVVFGANLDHTGANTILKMDIFEPDGDVMPMRPLIILAHGGSFVGGDKSNQDQADLCTHFAKRGYVCATINYRLGIAFPINAATATDAVYRSVQDMKAAIRFFRKDAATNNNYKIDPGVVFVGGTSAGAFTALHLAYMDTYAELPSTIDTAALGDLEGNSGNPGYATNVNAVINLCGALGEANWIIPGDPPLVSMHGTNDGTVPYATAMLYLLNIFPIMVVDGSYSIHSYLNTINHPNEMYTWYGQGHVPYYGATPANLAYLDTSVRFVSNFLYKYYGCTPTDLNPIQNTFLTSGTGDLVMENDVRLGNNPVNEFVTLYQESNRNYQFTMMNAAGQTVAQTVGQANGQIPFTFSVKELASGLYFLHYKAVDKSGILKVVVQH